jgi:hypothetical protein
MQGDENDDHERTLPAARAQPPRFGFILRPSRGFLFDRALSRFGGEGMKRHQCLAPGRNGRCTLAFLVCRA